MLRRAFLQLSSLLFVPKLKKEQLPNIQDVSGPWPGTSCMRIEQEIPDGMKIFSYWVIKEDDRCFIFCRFCPVKKHHYEISKMQTKTIEVSKNQLPQYAIKQQ